MDKKMMVIIAKKAIEKRWDFETLTYCDDMHGNEQFADDVWELVEECDKIGRNAFYIKYPITK